MRYTILLFSLIFAAALMSGSCAGVLPVPKLAANEPRIVPAQELPTLIRKLPSYTRLGYTGLAYFRGKLYGATNVGLIEFVDGNPSQVYKWKDGDDVLSGPWFDAANDSLWAMHDGLGRLVRFDGTDWHLHDLPQPDREYTRGDMLRGFNGIGNRDGFWIEGAGQAWRWDSANSSWKALQLPSDASTLRLIPLAGHLIAVTDTNPVTVQEYTNGWKKLHVSKSENFQIEQVAVTDDKGFVRTDQGEVFRITRSEVKQISAGRKCEAIAVSTSGLVIASFGSEGIFEYSDDWKRRFAPTFDQSEPEHWADLAESEGRFALSITSKPEGYGGNATYPGQTALWTSSGNELLRVSLGDR